MNHNSVLDALCSIDDLRCALTYCETAKSIPDIQEAIEEEMKHKKRTSALKMLNAKLKALRK